MAKVLFIDIDGTLVDYSGQLPDSAVEAIRRARCNGHKVYLCTGRSRAEIYSEIWEIGVDGLIGGNGNYIENQGQEIFHHTLSEGECAAIVEWLNKNKLVFYLESNAGLFGSADFEAGAESAIQAYAAGKGNEHASSMTVRKAFPDMIFGENLIRDDVNKISYVLHSYADYVETEKHFPNLKNGTWGGKGEEALFGDIGTTNVSKAFAVETLLRAIDADVQDTIAFGDAKIDIPMFACCNKSVCMGNGGEEAKQAADFITDPVDQDGLYKAFEKLGLI